MKNLFTGLAMMTLLSASTANSQQARPSPDPNNGSVIEDKVYSFPSYSKAVETTNVEAYATEQAYAKAAGDQQYELRKLRYISDGLKVVAYLYKPLDVERKRLPVIVFNRGGAVRGDIAPELVTFFHRLATQGFVILAPMYRQSDSGEGHDEIGGADVDDLMNVLPLVSSLGFVDLNNLFMYGESRGGMMTYQAVKKGFPLKAAAVFGAFTDLGSLLTSRPDVYKPAMLKRIWSDFDTRKDAIIKVRSALQWPDRLNVPLLIMHGGSDQDVNPSQSLALAQELQKLGKTYELIVYAQDGHILSRNQEDRDRRAVAWFKMYMKN